MTDQSTDDDTVSSVVEFDSEVEREFAVNQLLFSAETIEEAVEEFGAAELDEHGHTEKDAIRVIQSIADQIAAGD
jgi:hypothetical protein